MAFVVGFSSITIALRYTSIWTVFISLTMTLQKYLEICTYVCNYFKGGLISESFFLLWLKYPKQRCQITLLIISSFGGLCASTSFWDLGQREKLSEIKSTLDKNESVIFRKYCKYPQHQSLVLRLSHTTHFLSLKWLNKFMVKCFLRPERG